MTITTPPAIPPHSIEAEQAALGAILLDAAALATAREILTPADFYKSADQKIFETMLELADSGLAIDNITLTDALDRKRLLPDIGGATYVAELLSLTASSANVRHYCEIVARTACHR